MTPQVVASEIQVVTVADQEADIYGLFATARPANSEKLIQATHNRQLTRSEVFTRRHSANPTVWSPKRGVATSY